MWHFVSPDSQTNVPYAEIWNYFPDLVISGGEDSYLTLSNIPAEFDGWGSYCMFTNEDGSASSSSGVAYTHVDTAESSESEEWHGAPIPDGDPFLGTIVEEKSGLGSMSVTTDGDLYHVTAEWSNDPSEDIVWTFSGHFNARAVMEYSDCTKTVTTYGADGASTEEVAYTGGTGYIRMNDYGIEWADDQGDIVSGTFFSRQ